MGQQVASGAMLQCSFGMAPSTLAVVSPQNTAQKMPIATIMDNVPFLNIMPFGPCSSLSNPTVASATAAALGVLTPMPCTPVIPAPWAPGSMTVTVGKKPALTSTSQCMCAYGGLIKTRR